MKNNMKPQKRFTHFTETKSIYYIFKLDTIYIIM